MDFTLTAHGSTTSAKGGIGFQRKARVLRFDLDARADQEAHTAQRKADAAAAAATSAERQKRLDEKLKDY